MDYYFNDKEILESKVRDTYPDLTDDQVTKILRKNIVVGENYLKIINFTLLQR